MKFVYIDETGTGEEPISVMVGVITDSYKMRLTKFHWNNLLTQLSKIIGRKIDEIHTRDFYSGNSPWRELKGQQRAKIIDAIFNWLDNRQHSLVYSAVNKKEFFNDLEKDPKLKEIGSLWRFMAIHISLSLQKNFQGSRNGKKDRKINAKGSFVLIFDHEHREQGKYTNLVLSPPDWTDCYYDKREKQEKMSQLIDVPHFVDSKQVGLIQLADFICFFLRKHVELSLNLIQPAYKDEKEKVSHWADLILKRAISKNNIYKARGRCESEELFYKYAPEPLV